MLLLVSIILMFSSDLYGKFKIAVIYPFEKNNISTNAGEEAICVSKAVFDEAKKNGLNIQVDYFDNQRTPIGTKEISNKISELKYDISLGTFSSSRSIVAAKILNSNSIPFISLTASSPEIMIGNNLTATLASSDKFYLKRLSDYIKNRLKPKKIFAVVNLSKLSSTSALKELKLALLNTKIKLETFEIVSGYSEYPELAKKIDKSESDLIFLPLHSFESGSVYIALKELSKKFSIVGGGSIGGRSDFHKLIGKTSPNIDFKFFKQWNSEANGRMKNHFDRIMAMKCPRFNHSMISVFSYDLSLWIVNTLNRKKFNTGKEFFNYFLSTSFEGATNVRKFNSDKFSRGDLHIYQIKNNKTSFKESY